MLLKQPGDCEMATQSFDFFNSHSNQNRIFGNKGGACPAPAIKAKDETAYSRAMEKAAMGKRNVKVTLNATPW